MRENGVHTMVKWTICFFNLKLYCVPVGLYFKGTASRSELGEYGYGITGDTYKDLGIDHIINA